MQRIITEFKCDECDKIIAVDSGGFPYEKGWRYIFKLKYKNSNKVENPKEDKHFCSKKCITKWFGKLITPKKK